GPVSGPMPKPDSLRGEPFVDRYGAPAPVAYETPEIVGSPDGTPAVRAAPTAALVTSASKPRTSTVLPKAFLLMLLPFVRGVLGISSTGARGRPDLANNRLVETRVGDGIRLHNTVQRGLPR